MALMIPFGPNAVPKKLGIPLANTMGKEVAKMKRKKSVSVMDATLSLFLISFSLAVLVTG